jgi:hypothetical protein
MKIFDELALRKIRHIIRTSKRQKAFPIMSEVHKILILCTNTDLEIKLLIAGFEKEGKKVEVWAYGKQADYKKQTTAYKRFGSRDTTLLGLPKNYILRDFSGKHYDLVIDFTRETVVALQYLLAQADVPFKAGMKKQFADNYDLMIDADRLSENELLSQIIFYLTMIEAK